MSIYRETIYRGNSQSETLTVWIFWRGTQLFICKFRTMERLFLSCDSFFHICFLSLSKIMRRRSESIKRTNHATMLCANEVYRYTFSYYCLLSPTLQLFILLQSVYSSTYITNQESRLFEVASRGGFLCYSLTLWREIFFMRE